MANVIIDVAAEFTGKKAFDKAGKATSNLEKNVKSLASAFGIAFSTRAVANFAKASVKAFADDDRAITVLRTNLKNLGLAYQATNAEDFIAKLEQQSAILDDQLRPAYAQLSKVTLSTTKTQELMALAVDLARANGLEFTQVINTLSRAYVGNYKGLKQLNIGLTDAELKTKSFAEIQEILIKQSKGAGKAYIETFAGSIDKLSVAGANAKEVIGEGLVDLFADMAGNGDIEKATANVDKLSEAVGQFLKDVSEYNFFDYVNALLTGQVTESTAEKLVKRPSARRFFTGGSGKSDAQLELERRAREEKAAKAAAAAKIKADKLAAANKLKLEKAAALFDQTKISIAAALKGKISEEEKIRLLLMQAIEEENAKKAEDLSKKLKEIQDKNAEIAKSLTEISDTSNPFQAWADSLGAAAAILGGMPALINASGGLTGRGKVTLPTGDALPSPTDTPSIFTPDMTATEIADTATAAADMAIAAAEAAAAAVLAAEPIVTAITEAATAATNIADVVTNDTNTYTGSSSIFNPYATTPGSSAGFGTQAPTIIVNNNGTTLMQDEFVKAVGDALIVSNTNGTNNYRPGALDPAFI
jgi:hypothetical protein